MVCEIECCQTPCIWIPLRLVNAGFAVLFGYSGVVNFDDEDGPLWVILYFVACGFCILAELSLFFLRRYIFRPALYIWTIGIFIFLLYLIIDGGIKGDITFEAEEGQDEYETLGYEIMGTLLIFVWMIVIVIMDQNHVIGIFGYTMLGIDDEE